MGFGDGLCGLAAWGAFIGSAVFVNKQTGGEMVNPKLCLNNYIYYFGGLIIYIYGMMSSKF